MQLSSSLHCFNSRPELTERFENVGRGLIRRLPVRLVALGAVLGFLPLLLVAGLASVASPAVVALGNVHANVHSVVTCHNTMEKRKHTHTHSGQITPRARRKSHYSSMLINLSIKTSEEDWSDWFWVKYLKRDSDASSASRVDDESICC